MRRLCLVILLFAAIPVQAGKIKKAFEALEIYNYFEAKRLFEKTLDKHPVPSAFGLSIIYARKDNPFSDLDSAYNMIYRSFSSIETTNDRLMLKYLKVGVDSLVVVKQRNHVSKLMFERAKFVQSVYGYQDFIDKNPWSTDVDSAIYLRDELAFNLAVSNGSSKSFEEFIQAYPQSVFSSEAQDLLDETLYKEQTYTNSFVDYVNFVKNYPNSPYRGQAEDKIYEISTKTGTVEAFRGFIIEFPNNRNIRTAWKHLYNAKMKEGYSSQNIMAFKNEYPDYPYQKELQEEYNMADKILFPIRNEGNWGFADANGNVIIDTKYESVEWYVEGLTVVKVGDAYGYLNKLGNLIIPPSFNDALSFSEGHALVEVDDYWGMIDRNGEFIINPQYEELGILSNGLCYFQEGELFGYFDAKGNVRLPAQYTEAYDFENGYAVVSKNDYYGVIDLYGTTYLPFKFEDLMAFDSSFYLAMYQDYWGVINFAGDTLLPFEYDYVGKPKNGLSLVELDDEYNYLQVDSKSFLLEEWVEVYPEYRQLGLFRNGYAKVKDGEGYNLIDSSGVKLFKKPLEDVGGFGDLIPRKKNGTWGYISRTGKQIIDSEYSYAYSFGLNEEAIVQQEPFFGLIDKKGEFSIAPLFEDLRKMNDSTYLAKSLGSYGLLNHTGDTLLNFQYINIEPISDLVVKIEEGTDVFYYHLATKEFIRRED